jgi:hypothetical protein
MYGSPNIHGHISEAEQARRSGVTVSTLRRWRKRGYGPRAVKFGRFVLYPEDSNEQFLAELKAAAENPPRLRGRGRAG